MSVKVNVRDAHAPLNGAGPLTRVWRWIALHSPQGVLVDGKPRTYREMLRVLWENRTQLPYAWRILTRGVCDGCALGPRGLRDDVTPGVHLCLTRLSLLRLNTMDAMRDGAWSDMARLRAMSNEDLHRLGRVPYPLRRDQGDRGFRRITWDDALAAIAQRVARTAPERVALFATSRGTTNETYYMAQRWMRFVGSPHMDTCARLCHAASTTGLMQTIGYGAPTISLRDIIGTELLVLWGSNVANNQPVMMKYLHYAKKAGTRIVVINPYVEEGLVRYWIPSIASSAMWGTRIMDEHISVRPGGDIAFGYGVLKALLDIPGAVDDVFVREHTSGFDALAAHVRTLGWDALGDASGVAPETMRAFAEQYARARSAVIVYSMGLTQHAHGVDNVYMLVNLLLARGMFGRAHAGILPIRGHSGVQGGPECGLDPSKAPGARPLTDDVARELETVWGFPVPRATGYHTARMLHAARAGEIDVLYTIGGNLYETMPDPASVADAFARTPLRVHQDIVLNTSAVLDPAETVIVLPAQTRYEQDGGGTSTSTERRVRFTPEIPGRRIGEARAEWRIFNDLALAMNGGRTWRPLATSAAVRAEMARTIPLYAGIDALARHGDSVQWGGALLCEGGRFPRMPGERALFSVVDIPRLDPPDGAYVLVTRRGKQFNTITFGQTDPLTNTTTRQTVLMHAADLAREGLRDGADVTLVSPHGRMHARVQRGGGRPRTIHALWPEANVLLDERLDPVSFEPDYNTIVRLAPARMDV